jgi:hypothetical protein
VVATKKATMGQPVEAVENGLSAYVDVHDHRSDLLVVLCRACGDRSPPLAYGEATDWFKGHAAKKTEEHRRWRARQGPL